MWFLENAKFLEIKHMWLLFVVHIIVLLDCPLVYDIAPSGHPAYTRTPLKTGAMSLAQPNSCN